MPIIGWYCVKCRSNVPLNHFESCEAVHPDYAATVLADSRRDRTTGVHVTSALSCPRRSAIEAQVGYHTDPLSHNAMVGGTAWHALVAQNNAELCEVEVGGVIGGVVVAGTVDRLRPPAAIDDWKVTSEWAEKWLMKPVSEGGGAKPEHIAQLSLYAELVEQTFGWRPQTGTLWYRTHKRIMPFTVTLWDLKTVLAFKPLAGEWSVAELVNQLDRLNKHQAGTGAIRCEWYELPLVGETQRYGAKSACDYCAVRDVCFTAAKGAPF